jgi:DNA-binding response OmpR family regulator
VISLKQNLSILLYEKEKILNSILHYQISKYNDYDLLIVENDEELYETVTDRSFDACILNLNNLCDSIKNLTNILQSKNENVNIIAYHEPFYKKIIGNIGKVFLLEKPFKLITLLNYLDSVNYTENMVNSNKHLMDHIIFSPSKKTISNLETNYTEHLTEKENNLLIYFYNKKNEEILKKDLLIKIWGFSEKINTHTLETHIYRLKQKLNKIDKNLSLSLRSRNGLYYLKYNS